MKLYQPTFTDGKNEVLAPFLIQAENPDQAMQNALDWLLEQEIEVQQYFIPHTDYLDVQNVVERNPNKFGIIIIP